jgi:hypothetical protein
VQPGRGGVDIRFQAASPAREADHAAGELAAVRVDGYLAHQFLMQLGIVPDCAAMLALTSPTSSMTSEEQGGLRQAVMVAACMLQAEEAYGQILPADVKSRLKQMENGV